MKGKSIVHFCLKIYSFTIHVYGFYNTKFDPTDDIKTKSRFDLESRSTLLSRLVINLARYLITLACVNKLSELRNKRK